MTLALALVPLISTLLLLRGKTAMTLGGHNYRRIPVSRSGGIIIYLSYLPAGVLYLLLPGTDGEKTLVALYLVSALAFLGLLDDVGGGFGPKGFRGHILHLFQKKELSTGLIKAVFGAAVALSVSAHARDGAAAVLVGGGVVALMANTSNSLDLRPGRSVKFFLSFSLALVVLSREEGAALLLMPFMASALVYLPYEFQETVMLGDSGSNVLGGALGYVFILYSSFAVQLAALALLILFQLFCEGYSLSRVIEGSSFLRYLDNLGRVFKEEGEHEE